VTDRKLAAVAVAVAVQAVATVFFLADAIADVVLGSAKGMSVYHGMELLISLALVAGVLMGMWLMRRLLAETRRQEAALAVARGALADLIASRFAEWKLTEAEQEVALFALKGCDVAEIARLRHSAAGTVRAQLSHVYTKAGVTGQAMLMSLFVEDLLDVPA
jgi:DNA-binding NarL/FixJ family response regulator